MKTIRNYALATACAIAALTATTHYAALVQAGTLQSYTISPALRASVLAEATKWFVRAEVVKNGETVASFKYGVNNATLVFDQESVCKDFIASPGATKIADQLREQVRSDGAEVVVSCVEDQSQTF